MKLYSMIPNVGRSLRWTAAADLLGQQPPLAFIDASSSPFPLLDRSTRAHATSRCVFALRDALTPRMQDFAWHEQAAGSLEPNFTSFSALHASQTLIAIAYPARITSSHQPAACDSATGAATTSLLCRRACSTLCCWGERHDGCMLGWYRCLHVYHRWHLRSCLPGLWCSRRWCLCHGGPLLPSASDLK